MRDLLWSLILLFPFLLFPEEVPLPIQEAIHRGDRALTCALDEEALEFYSFSLNSLKDSPPQFLLECRLRERIATIHLEAKRFLQALEALQPLPLPLARSTALLRAEAHQQLRQYPEAEQCLAGLDSDAEVLLKKGILYFLEGRIGEAEKTLQLIDRQETLYPNAQLYLARLYLSKGEIEEAERTFQFLNHTLPLTHPLLPELSFFRGEAAFRNKQYETALLHYQASCSSRTAPWYRTALEQSAECLLIKALTAYPSFQEAFFIEALVQFRKVHTQYPDSASLLALCRALIAQSKSLLQPEKRLEALSYLRSLPTSNHTQLLQADALPTYQEREDAYYRLCHQFSHVERDLETAWLQRGLNSLEEGQRLHRLNNEIHAEDLLQAANAAFYKALELAEKNSSPQTAPILAYLALSFSSLPGAGRHEKALEYLEKALLLEKSCAPLYILKGQLLAHFENRSREEVAEALYETIHRFPKGLCAESALYLLALWHAGQKQFPLAQLTLEKLTEHYPSSPHVAEALFWTAHCLEESQGERAHIQRLRARVFQEYPNSSLAAEAYFLYFPYEDYLDSEPAALKHLQNMAERFPSSPYSISAYYLIGLEALQHMGIEKSDQKLHESRALEAFQEAETLFDSLLKQDRMTPNELTYFTTLRFRAALERAGLNLNIALKSEGAKRHIYLAYSTSAYQSLLEILSSPEHAVTSTLPAETLPGLFEECQFGLAEAYLKGDDSSAATHILNELIANCGKKGITRGYFLARAHHLLAVKAMEQGHFLEAQKGLNAAEACSKGRLFSHEERLELWMRQSACYRACQDYEPAMKLLSKVINEDCVSSLRLKAMFLRAELYEEQGRPELAQKQLKALASKSGEWAVQAKKKLEHAYGLL